MYRRRYPLKNEIKSKIHIYHVQTQKTVEKDIIWKRENGDTLFYIQNDRVHCEPDGTIRARDATKASPAQKAPIQRNERNCIFFFIRIHRSKKEVNRNYRKLSFGYGMDKRRLVFALSIILKIHYALVLHDTNVQSP